MKVVTAEYEKLEMDKLLEKFRLDYAIEESKRLTGWLEELKAYHATGYTPQQITELHDKHWNECRQIAHYDNELKKESWMPLPEPPEV